uniref:DUF1084 domain-containing protein n=1 Tax=Panagrellus redivivus TaxID=6233 RepID=A0A7E4UNY7_PANRE
MLIISISPMHYMKSEWGVDKFALVVLIYAIGVAWYQCDSIARDFRKLRTPYLKLKEVEDVVPCRVTLKVLMIVYKLISIFLAFACAHLALIMIRLACPHNDPIGPIASCLSAECISLYLATTASYYWTVACPLIQMSMYFP